MIDWSLKDCRARCTGLDSGTILSTFYVAGCD